MSRRVLELSVLVLTSCLIGISFDTWVGMEATFYGSDKNPLSKSMAKFDLLFSTCLITSIMSTAWLIMFMMRSSYKMFGQIAVGLHLVVLILWLVTLIATAKGMYQYNN